MSWEMTNDDIKRYVRKEGMYVGVQCKQVEFDCPHISKETKKLVGTKKFLGLFTMKQYEIVEQKIEFTVGNTIVRTKRFDYYPYYKYKSYSVQFAFDREDEIVYWKVVNISAVRNTLNE